MEKGKRFSKQELFSLRNHIKINNLISDILAMPSKFSDGYLRFSCPLCSEFLTATNSETNLGRCFRCNKNFNTIDLVMLDKKLNFVDAVEFLQQSLH